MACKITLLSVSAASPSMDNEHGIVCQPILEHHQASSQGPPVSAVVYAAADWWLSTIRQAPLWLFSESSAVYKYSDLLTYLPYCIVLYDLEPISQIRRKGKSDTRANHSAISESENNNLSEAVFIIGTIKPVTLVTRMLTAIRMITSIRWSDFIASRSHLNGNESDWDNSTVVQTTPISTKPLKSRGNYSKGEPYSKGA